MKISTRSQYGLRLMLELALSYGKGPQFLRHIATNQELSEKYLSQIILPLKAGGLVRSLRGAHGGYMLEREPSRITVSEIVRLLDGEFTLAECITNPAACRLVARCSTKTVWRKAGEAMEATLKGITLEDLVQDQRAMEPIQNSYAI